MRIKYSLKATICKHVMIIKHSKTMLLYMLWDKIFNKTYFVVILTKSTLVQMYMQEGNMLTESPFYKQEGKILNKTLFYIEEGQ